MRRVLAALTVTALALAGCADDDDGGGAAAEDGGEAGPSLPGGVVVFNGQGNHLDAYEPEPPFADQRVITAEADDPDGRDVNGQICFFPDGSGRFIAGEDTGQPDPPAGWGIFRLTGDGVGSLEAEQIGKLTPTYQEGAEAENYGCGILPDGRMLTTDVGGQRPGDPGNGQLIVWFGEPEGEDQAYCKVDVEVATAQSILVEGDDVYVASARPPSWGVWRYTDLPTGDDAAGGCGDTDATGAPLADGVTRELVLGPGADGILAPTGLAPAPGGFYLSSVITGVINEYGLDGTFVRNVLAPPEGDEIGAGRSLSTGTPLGLGVGPDGTLYYADIGIVDDPERGLGPGDGAGRLWRITFEGGDPQPPEVMVEGLAFPDGIGVWPGA